MGKAGGRPESFCFFQPNAEEAARGRETTGSEAYRSQVQRLAQEIAEADAVVVGAGSGLSSADGNNHYHDVPVFDLEFAAFKKKYGFRSMGEGYYYLYPSLESQWAYYARYLQFMQQAPAGQAYRDLLAVLEEKDYFIITTNVDGQFERAGFPMERVARFQGDAGYFQCSQPCHDHLYPSQELVNAMVAATDGDQRVPSDLVPRCPECGWQMMPWIRDDTFLQGEAWQGELGRYQDFVRERLASGKRVLLLSLGVGDMTPAVITLPFWRMAQAHENTRLGVVNLAKGSAPAQLGNRSFVVQGDLSRVLVDLRLDLH